MSRFLAATLALAALAPFLALSIDPGVARGDLVVAAEALPLFREP